MQAGGQRAGKKVRYEYEDVEAVREEVPIVRAVSGEVNRNLAFKYGTRVVSLKVRGVDLPYGSMRKLDVEDGRYFSDRDFVEHNRVVILGHNANKRVFQGAPAVGQSVSIGGMDFEVIGVLRNKLQDSSYNGPDNNDGFVPFDIYRDLRNIRDPDLIIIQPTAPELNKKALAAVREVIARRHHFDPQRRKGDSGVGHHRRPQHAGRVLLRPASGARVDWSGHAGSGRRGRDEHHAGFRDGAHSRDWVAQGLGARRGQVLLQFLLEALVLTFSGGLIGVGSRDVSDLGHSADASL